MREVIGASLFGFGFGFALLAGEWPITAVVGGSLSMAAAYAYAYFFPYPVFEECDYEQD